MHDIVRTVDLDCDGYVSWEEFKRAFHEPGKTLTTFRVMLQAWDDAPGIQSQVLRFGCLELHCRVNKHVELSPFHGTIRTWYDSESNLETVTWYELFDPTHKNAGGFVWVSSPS